MHSTNATSEEFRPLPTPEQVRAHGDGGLWESDNKQLYKLFDRPRDESWWDFGGAGGTRFCTQGPWWAGKGFPDDGAFRPLRAIGEVRPWSEIDAITGTTATPATPATPAIVLPPVERVSFVSRPSVAAEPATATVSSPEPEFRIPTDDEIRAHEANGGIWMWRWKLRDCFRFLGFRDDILRGWNGTLQSLVEDVQTLPKEAWDVKERELRDSHLCPVDKKGVPMPWPKPVQAKPIEPAMEPVQGLLASSAIVTRADSLGAEAQKQIAQTVREELAARGFELGSVGTALVDVFATQHAEFQRQIAQVVLSTTPTKENTNMSLLPNPTAPVYTVTTTPKTSLPATLKQELKEDGIEILYRGTARTLNREAKDLVVKYLVSQLPAKKRKGAMTMFAAAFDTEAGTALCGALLSLLPHMAAYMGKPVGPKLTRLARECRREGGTDAVARIMGELMGMLKLLTELGDKYLSSLPDDEAKEADAPASAGSLPSASPVVDFSAPLEMAKVGA